MRLMLIGLESLRISEVSWRSLEVLVASGTASPMVECKLFCLLIGIWNLPRASHAWFSNLVAQMGKNLPAMQETRVQALAGKIPWRREWQPSIHAWRIPWGLEESDTTKQLTFSTLSLRVAHTGVITSKSEQTLALCKRWLLYFFKILIYLAALGLCCGMWDLVPWPVIEPKSLHWKYRFSATGTPGKVTMLGFFKAFFMSISHLPTHGEDWHQYGGQHKPQIRSGRLKWQGREGLLGWGLIIVFAKSRHFQRLLSFGLKSVASQVSWERPSWLCFWLLTSFFTLPCSQELQRSPACEAEGLEMVGSDKLRLESG